MATSLKDWNDGKGGEWREFLGEFYTGTDREAGILGGAFLDEHLRALLRQLKVDDPAEQEKLVGLDNRSSKFHDLLDAAKGNKLIGPSESHDLKVIARIRDGFAHGLHGLSFDEKHVTAECAQLKAANLDPDTKAVRTARQRFDLTVVLLAEQISHRAEKAMRGDRTPPTDYGIATWFFSNRQKPTITFTPKRQDQTGGEPPSEAGQ